MPPARSAKNSIRRTTSRHPPAMRRHLAKVLLARCVSALLARPDLGAGGVGVTAPVHISLEVNGERVDAHVLPRLNLADFLREHLKLTGTHVGCEHGVCGACTVRVDGDIVRSCLMLAVQTHNASVETIEGLSDSRRDRRSAGGVPRPQRAAMRLLHAGHADGGAGSVADNRRPGPRADPRTSFRQLLPLHRLSGHHRRGRGHGAGARSAAS